MKLTEQHINNCLDAGFRKAFFQDGDLIAMFPGTEDENDNEMVVREIEGGFKACVLTGPSAMRSPKSITSANKNGYSPVYTFKTVSEAARMALDNPLY